eukprot:1193751-Prorocentrum_minimum.AAC.3
MDLAGFGTASKPLTRPFTTGEFNSPPNVSPDAHTKPLIRPFTTGEFNPPPECSRTEGGLSASCSPP